MMHRLVRDSSIPIIPLCLYITGMIMIVAGIGLLIITSTPETIPDSDHRKIILVLGSCILCGGLLTVLLSLVFPQKNYKVSESSTNSTAAQPPVTRVKTIEQLSSATSNGNGEVVRKQHYPIKPAIRVLEPSRSMDSLESHSNMSVSSHKMLLYQETYI